MAVDGEQESSERNGARAGTGQIALYALLWMVPLGALVGLAGIAALRQGASSTFRYVGF